MNVPGLNAAAVPVPWLNKLIGAASGATKRWLKQDIELRAHTEPHSGDDQRDIKLKQHPVYLGQTTLASSMNGLALPQATINVTSTVGFHPGTMGNPDLTVDQPGFAVQTGVSTWSYVTYTGTTTTSFTGCSGGSGSLTTANLVCSPVVWWDPNAKSGQAQGAFPDGTILSLGNTYSLVTDVSLRVSKRGLIRREGGQGAAFIGFYPEMIYQGKLGAYGLPRWSRGDGNIKVSYTSGYALGSNQNGFPLIPDEISYAAAALVAQMIRTQPVGADLSSESLGAYSYTILASDREWPQIGNLNRLLAPYREFAL
jgi:hypothetical protein